MIHADGQALYKKQTVVRYDQSKVTPLIGGWLRKEARDKKSLYKIERPKLISRCDAIL